MANELEVDPTPANSAPQGRVGDWLDGSYSRWILLGIATLLYIPFLGLRDFWYPDEPDIAEVCRAMFQSGDWIAPRRMGLIWVDYPPMIYWAGTLASHLLGGVSEFSLRLPNALASIATLGLVHGAATRWFGVRAGAWAGLALLVLNEFARQAFSYRPDVLFSLWITAGLLLYIHGTEGRARWGPRLLAFACLGLAMLAKGPLGLLLPGLILVLWHASRREWRRIFELAPLAAVAMAVYLPWFIACARAMGSDNILYEFWAQNFGRFASGSRGHEKPLYYYFVFFWNLFWPWSLLFPFAVAWAVRRRLWRDPRYQLALWWFGASIVFLSFAATKRGVYLLPLYPALALIIAPWLASVGTRSTSDAPDPRPAQVFVRASSLVTAAAAVIVLGVSFNVDRIAARLNLDPLTTEVARALPVPLVLTALVLAFVAGWIALAWRRGDLQQALVRTALAHVPLYLVLIAVCFPAFDPIKSYRAQGAWIRQEIGGETVFGLSSPHRTFGWRKMGAFGYYTGVHVQVLRQGPEIIEFLADHPQSMVLVEISQAAGLLDQAEPNWVSRVQGGIQTGSHHYWILRSAAPAQALPEKNWLYEVSNQLDHGP